MNYKFVIMKSVNAVLWEGLRPIVIVCEANSIGDLFARLPVISICSIMPVLSDVKNMYLLP